MAGTCIYLHYINVDGHCFLVSVFQIIQAPPWQKKQCNRLNGRVATSCGHAVKCFAEAVVAAQWSQHAITSKQIFFFHSLYHKTVPFHIILSVNPNE